MKIETNDLSLFGLDLSQAFGYIKLAWRDLLWNQVSPLRRAFAETVRVRSLDVEQEGYYRLGQKQNLAAPKVQANAFILPDEIVLFKSLQLPVAVEVELAEVVRLEVLASCPFAIEEATYAWLAEQGDAETITVQVAMARQADIDACLLENAIDAGKTEIWAMTPSGVACFDGQAVDKREGRYKRRLLSTAVLVVASYLLLLFAPAVISSARAIQAEKVEQQYVNLKQSSAKAVALKESLAQKNVVLAEVEALLIESPSLLPLLSELTRLAEDDVWFRNVRLDKNKLQLTGYATNAAEFMQQLSSHDSFQQVKQRGGIRKDRASGQEVFTVEMQLSATRVEGESQ
ncbi:PilN domain-containing protein [Pseudoteredinibacter isoporae]|uniref:PilN domain-containing protein n=1 Tax=Pseudoteredinibacter isoporae TaxID=570281 RepID=UPI0031076BC7